MHLSDSFFAEFPPISKAEWLAKINKDLKDRPIADLMWHPAADIEADPFGHPDDFEALLNPLSAQAANWQIAEDVEAVDAAVANAQALEALTFGAEALRFVLPTVPDQSGFGQLLRDIHLDYIGLHFAGKGVEESPSLVLALLQGLAQQRGLDPKTLNGSLAYAPLIHAERVDWRYLADLLAFAGEAFPQFSVISVEDGTADGNPANVVEELAALLQQGHFYIEKLTEKDMAAGDIASKIVFSMTVGKSYFFEIAKIRAFKLLWLNVLKGWGAPLEAPKISARFAEQVYTDDLYTNMIRATTMAMSSVLGGVDRLTVLPYDAGREGMGAYPQNFSRRIARNVQHLLKMESGLHEIPDAAAGSFYIEKLTAQIASAVWKKFQS